MSSRTGTTGLFFFSVTRVTAWTLAVVGVARMRFLGWIFIGLADVRHFVGAYEIHPLAVGRFKAAAPLQLAHPRGPVMPGQRLSAL